jgi:hypothetical protein
MPIVTDSVTYNVRQRGRQYRGADRNFDTVALAALINSPKVQEKVKHGDMFGYYGHWVRECFGMNPPESVMHEGKHVPLLPALRTVELAADTEGNITHRSEFLDNVHGEAAANLWKNKSGGWSSVIVGVPGTMPVVGRDFCGFDYVKEPNFSTNRSHKLVLDGVEEGSELYALLDEVVGDHLASAAAFDSLHRQHLLALQSLEKVVNENHDLLDRLARAGNGSAILDSVGRQGAIMSVQPDFEQWRDKQFAALQRPPAGDEPDPMSTAEGRVLAKRFGQRWVAR